MLASSPVAPSSAVPQKALDGARTSCQHRKSLQSLERRDVHEDLGVAKRGGGGISQWTKSLRGDVRGGSSSRTASAAERAGRPSSSTSRMSALQAPWATGSVCRIKMPSRNPRARAFARSRGETSGRSAASRAFFGGLPGPLFPVD